MVVSLHVGAGDGTLGSPAEQSMLLTPEPSLVSEPRLLPSQWVSEVLEVSTLQAVQGLALGVTASRVQ